MKPSDILEKLKGKSKEDRSRLAFKGGSYSLAVTAIVLAILIAVNVLVSALPATLTRADISSTKLYSITSNTKVVVNALEEDVVIYWIVQSDAEDSIIENLLAKYESLSQHIKVVKKNPDVFPTFAAQYTSEDVPNNSLIVECGDRSRFISYNDIYLTEANMSTYSMDTSFDGEGAITSAIDYVVNEEQPLLYVLEGHGEGELPESFAKQIEKENIETVSFSLLKTDSIPEEADAVLIYAPSSDISTEEKKLLADYYSEK
ncbi:MAG: Gldg family protein [Lachnospiraceae bacterium]